MHRNGDSIFYKCWVREKTLQFRHTIEIRFQDAIFVQLARDSGFVAMQIELDGCSRFVIRIAQAFPCRSFPKWELATMSAISANVARQSRRALQSEELRNISR
jgi:hypothetical protein